MTEEDLRELSELAETLSDSAPWREHRYVGGPPTRRLRRMQLAHEVRARRAGVQWEMVDLRIVYKAHDGVCGICNEHVPLHTATFDHIIPLVKGGPHVLSNLQPAHKSCNSRKGCR